MRSLTRVFPTALGVYELNLRDHVSRWEKCVQKISLMPCRLSHSTKDGSFARLT